MSGVAVVVDPCGVLGTLVHAYLTRSQFFGKVRLLLDHGTETSSKVPAHDKVERVYVNRDRLAEANHSFDGADVTFCCVDLTKVHRSTTASPKPTASLQSDLDYALGIARTSMSCGVRAFMALSLDGADEKSDAEPLRSCGVIESALKEMKFPCGCCVLRLKRHGVGGDARTDKDVSTVKETALYMVREATRRVQKGGVGLRLLNSEQVAKAVRPASTAAAAAPAQAQASSGPAGTLAGIMGALKRQQAEVSAEELEARRKKRAEEMEIREKERQVIREARAEIEAKCEAFANDRSATHIHLEPADGTLRMVAHEIADMMELAACSVGADETRHVMVFKRHLMPTENEKLLLEEGKTFEELMELRKINASRSEPVAPSIPKIQRVPSGQRRQIDITTLETVAPAKPRPPSQEDVLREQAERLKRRKEEALRNAM